MYSKDEKAALNEEDGRNRCLGDGKIGGTVL
jgi:hypothetical protein